jgi:ribosomal protein S1
MEQEQLQGSVSFIHHSKGYGTIDYEQKGKSKSVTFSLKDQTAISQKTDKDHSFRIGDVVQFQVKRSERGDKTIASGIRFLYNTELEKLINRAQAENRFSGFLKLVDDQYFIKERDSYIFFPLRLSKWEKVPPESAFQTAIAFRLYHLDKPHAIGAELFSHDYIPAYRQARVHFDRKEPLEATVTRISPFAIYVAIFDGQMEAKLDISPAEDPSLKPGDKRKVLISFLNDSRIVLKSV